MKIGFDIRPLQESKKSGVGEYVHELLTALFKIDKQNEYFLFSNAKNIEHIDLPAQGNAKIVHKHFNRSNKSLNFRFKFLNSPKIDQMIGEKLDVMIFPNINFYSLSPGIKKILVVHDLSYEIFPEFYSAKSRLWHKMINANKFCQDANRIIAVSKNTKKDVQNIFKISENKIKVIHPGISNRFKTGGDGMVKEKYHLPEKFILYLGTIEPRKNVIGLISAFEKIKNDIPHHLVIAGAKGYKSDKALNRLGERMRYIDYVEDNDKPALYRSADIFAFPSFYEGFGFPPLEALASNTPVVASHTGSLGEVLEDVALLVNPYKDNEIAEVIKNLATNPELRNQLMEKKEKILQNYTWENAARQFLKCI